MGDILSAASLMLGIIGVLYGVWFQEISKAIEIPVPDFVEDRIRPRRIIKSVLLGRALPLALSALLLSAIFLPDAIKILAASMGNVNMNRTAALQDYNSVQAAFCCVVLGAILIAVHSAVRFLRLLYLLTKMK